MPALTSFHDKLCGLQRCGKKCGFILNRFCVCSHQRITRTHIIPAYPKLKIEKRSDFKLDSL